MTDLLRVNLTTGTSREETLGPDLLRNYIGGKGVGSHLLLEEVGPEVDPLSPGNKMIFAIGPITGTSMPGGNRYAAYFLSPLTGGYCESYSGGKLAPQFAATGYKVVILEGASETPVYLEISDRGATIHPADDLWGLDTYAAEEALLARTSAPRAQACVIGPAGEKLVRFALVANNKWRCLGRGGPGAVMGSKKVKGIVWHGSHKVDVARPAEFRALIKDMVERGRTDPSVARYQAMGTVQMVRAVNSFGAFPTRYWQKGCLEDFEPLTGETMMEKYQVDTTSCPPCIMHCGNLNRVPEGEPLAGLEIDGPEYETIDAFGGLCEIVDFAQIMRMNDICDRLGIDTMTAGNLCGLAIEACQQGRLDLGLEYGDAEGVAEFLQRMALRDGIGDVFADGILRVEREFGLEDLAVHVKGMEPAAFDPRRAKGMGLTYAMQEVDRAFATVLRTLENDLGMRVELLGPGILPREPNADEDWFTISQVEQARALGRETIEQQAELFDPAFLEQLRLGLGVDAETYVAARSRCFAYARELDRLLGDDSLLLTPTMALEGYLCDGRLPGKENPGSPPEACNNMAANMTGHPALSLPAGLLPNGLPFGIQMIAPRFREDLLLAAGRLWERQNPWPQTAPGYEPFAGAS